MVQADDEDRLLRAVGIQNAQAILVARRRAEEDLLRTKEALELRTRELAHSLAMARATLESTTDGILVTDAQEKVIDLNERYLAMWRLSRDTVAARPHAEIIDAVSPQFADPRPFRARIEAIYASASAETFDVLELADGRVFERFSRVQVVGGRDVGRVWSFRDITRHRRTEEALRESEARFRTMADAAPAMVWMTDASGTGTFFSRGWYEFTGQPEAGGPGWLDTVHPDDRESARRASRVAHRKREPFVLDYRLRRRDGVYRWALDSGRPRFDENGEFLGHIGSIIDITERKQAEETLREADRRKDEFLATLSHELRTPLTAMLGWVRILRSSGLDAPTAKRAVEVIERNVKHQGALITDLLDVSRIVSGTLTLEIDVVDMAALVTGVVETMRGAAEAKGLAVIMRPGRVALPLQGDAERLRQVVTNLLSNAVKFTPEGGSVTVALTRTRDRVRLAVSDTGEGISAAFLPHVFERFRQADTTSRRTQAGLGLGLAIVRHIVELHGGQVRADSDGEGKGATFTVDLPVAIVTDDARDRPADATETAESVARPLDGVTVLVVDDDRDSRELFEVILRHSGAAVTAAPSVAEALVALRRVRPDVLVCDLAMPGADGFALIREVRSWALAQGGAVPALALTAYARLEDRERALEAGFQLHLSKPAEPDDVVEAVARLARGRPAG